jgi:hypothetical protein
MWGTGTVVVAERRKPAAEGDPAVGVESDRLVFDYLSRVGDLAQTALPAAQRMRLVAQLRKDIDKERGSADSAAAVQRILGRIGSPDEVVEAAAGSTTSGAGAVPAAPEPVTEPPPGSYGPYAKPPRPPRAPRKTADVPPPRKDAEEPDWWRDPSGGGPLRAGDELVGLPGMTGGVFIPFDDEELDRKDPPPRRPYRRLVDAEEAEAEEDAEAYEEEGPRRTGPRRWLPRLRRAARGGEGGRRWGSPMLLVAAALLVGGAVIGSWIPLLLGWGAGYLSRGLSRPQAKFAVLGIPGATAVGMLVWLWGRDAGKWSTPVAQGQMGQAMQDALPVAVRVAAAASALYLLWRARRSA